MGARMWLIVGIGGSLDLLGRPVTQVFGNKTVGRGSAALGVVSLANMAVVGLGMLGGGGGIVCCEVRGGVEATFGGSSRLIVVVEGVEVVVSRAIVEAVLTARGSFSGFRVVCWGTRRAI